ncbi:MAG TPA: uroporphyrinogen-III C-methyltransferase [Solirubrobacteraceae bacterium]|nr:uroporphyrinogen-III C-methyltransferase [Solirubrobacteraceae bacterium]
MSGRVHLVGAGPGDPGLLTVRALQLIAQADVILYDRLIPDEALEAARVDAELLFVGKEGGGESIPQEQTEALLIARAQAGCDVVRLKGGDPFVFGRGGEEALALRDAGIPFDVVPGVTAGVAACAYAGIPVTHRGLSTGVALVTGHTRADGWAGETDGTGTADEAGTAGETGEAGTAGETGTAGKAGTAGEAGEADASGNSSANADEADASGEVDADEAALDWAALAAFPGTLVFYMGVRQLPRIAASLIRAGRPESEPAALVERGTLPDQRTVSGTLTTIAERAREESVQAPAIIVVGPVAQLSEQLVWRQPQPLAGRTVAVTRARAQTSGLAQRLRELGAHVVQAPAIRVRPLGEAGPAPGPRPGAPPPGPGDLPPGLGDLPPGPRPSLLPDFARYDLLCLTSANGVVCLFERLGREGRDARALAGTRVAAIGAGTAQALHEHGIAADVVPERAVAEGLVRALAGEDLERVLLATARGAREVLPDALRARGVEVDVWELYETVAEPLAPRILREAGAADYVTFTSASTVRFFLEAARAATDGGATAEGANGVAAESGDAIGGPLLSPTVRTVSIGPITSEALREHGLTVHVEAERHDVDGVVAAILADADAREE